MLDTEEGSRNRKDEEEIDLTDPKAVEKLRKEFVGELSSASFDEARRHNEEVMQGLSQGFDKQIKSRWVLRKDKDYLRLFRWLFVEQKKMADILMNLSEYAFDIKNMLFSVFVEIELMKGLTQKDIGTIKSRMDKILESPAVRELEKVLADNEEALTKLSEAGEKFLGDTVV